MTEKDLYAMQLRTRAERLLKLVDLKAPHTVIASEVVLVMKAAAGHCGEAFGQALQDAMLKAVRLGMDRCVDCGSDDGYDHQTKLCAKCLAEAAAMDDDDDERDDVRMEDLQ